MATGAISATDTVTITTHQVLRGAKEFANKFVLVPKTTQSLVATDAIIANDATLIRIGGSGGAVTLTSTPNIADGDPGQIIILVGTHDTNTVTVRDEASLGGCNLDLGGANRTLGAGDYLVLCFNTDTGLWEEIVFKNN
mgnify:CR=1 FL=1